jgi:hypothetical protein
VQSEKIQFRAHAEVHDEGPFKKRRGRKANVGHFYDDVRPDHFLRIIFKPTFGQLLITAKFVKSSGPIHSNIIVRSNQIG